MSISRAPRITQNLSELHKIPAPVPRIGSIGEMPIPLYGLLDRLMNAAHAARYELLQFLQTIPALQSSSLATGLPTDSETNVLPVMEYMPIASTLHTDIKLVLRAFADVHSRTYLLEHLPLSVRALSITQIISHFIQGMN